MNDRRYLVLLLGIGLVIAIQLGCTWFLVREERRNYAANVVETFKACKGVWNPWEPFPWK